MKFQWFIAVAGRAARRGGVLWLILCIAGNAAAQLRVPALPNTATLPNEILPATPLDAPARELGNTLDNLATPLNSAARTTLHQATARALLREHRDVLEADPNGAPMLRHQVMALNPTTDLLTRAQAAGFSVLREYDLAGLDTHIAVLLAPSDMTTARALQRLRVLDPNGSYDFNHVYLESGEGRGAASDGVSTPTQDNTRATQPKVGLIDSGVDDTHPVFQYSVIHRWGVTCADHAVPSAHGTAVASLLVGQSTRFHGAAPGAQLYAADVYCGSAIGGALNGIAAALSWLAQQQVPVINISLVGPPNVLLQQLVRMANARGMVIVAAVGNDGPAAPPLYPAAYPEVIGVTGVDARNRVLIEAGRGPQVKFAAPGADMAAATLNGAFINVRGTSFAAPIVAGLLAAALSLPDRVTATQALAQLKQQARDLGPVGRDDIYGEGLVGTAVRVALSDLMR